MKNLLFVVCHKKCSLPSQYPYKSISVGSDGHLIPSTWSDDTKDNISEKNPNYCELTAQYWVWKNICDEYDSIGLCHYRRFFAKSGINRFSLINSKTIDHYLKSSDVILPNKWYWDETVYEKYFKHGHGKEKDLILTRQVINEICHEYTASFDKIVNSNGISYCNMSIMKRENFIKYNTWLFWVLNEIENRVDISNYSKAEARIFGYLSEILLNVWIDYNNLKIKYVPLIETEAPAHKQLLRDIGHYRRMIRNV